VFVVWKPLGAKVLEKQRGGFIDLSGIKISLGLERTVRVNGQVVQSLTLTVPDLTSLQSKGSAGVVSVQGPGPISVSVPPVQVSVPSVQGATPEQPQPAAPRVSALSSPQPVGAAPGGVSPAHNNTGAPPGGVAVTQVASPNQQAVLPSQTVASTPQATSGAQTISSAQPSQLAAPQRVGSPPSVAPAASSASPLASPATQAGARAAAPISVQSQAVPTALIVQNGPGNFVSPEVLRNLGPGVLTLIQNTLNDQNIGVATAINLQVSGIGSLLRNEVLSNLNVTSRGFLGR
jgi:hypothetical protein